MMSKTATIFVDMKSPTIVCRIVDLSAGGACIEVPGNGAIPQRFVLNQGGVKKNCHVVWQKGRRIGVAY